MTAYFPGVTYGIPITTKKISSDADVAVVTGNISGLGIRHIPLAAMVITRPSRQCRRVARLSHRRECDSGPSSAAAFQAIVGGSSSSARIAVACDSRLEIWNDRATELRLT
jgi:hypothetical protein